MSFLSNYIRKTHHSFCSVVVAAAGSSARMGEDKLFLPLRGKPVLAWTLEALNGCGAVDEIILVTRPDSLDAASALKKDYALAKLSKVVLGGDTRTQSALAGVCEASPKAKIICIHDGARPFVSRDVIEDAVHQAFLHHAAAPAVGVKDTLKYASDRVVTATPDRAALFAVQTPQAFHADIIKAALSKAVQQGQSYTDDCAAVEALGVPVHLSLGREENIKLTTPADLAVAEAILARHGGRVI